MTRPAACCLHSLTGHEQLGSRGGKGSRGASAAHLHRPTSPDARAQRELLGTLRRELLCLEEAIPWNSVRRSWRNRRTHWRRGVKQMDAPADFAARLRVRLS